MKNVMLSIALMFGMTQVANAQLYKIDEDATACDDLETITLLYQALQVLPPNDALAAYEETINRELCAMTRPGLIGKLVDFNGPFYQLRVVNVPQQPLVWIRVHQLRE